MRQKTVLALIALIVFMKIPFLIHAKEDVLKKAQKSMDLMDYDQAVFYYEQALNENPSKPAIRPLLGFCYFRTGRYEDAIRVCTDELAHFPLSLPTHTLLSYVCFHQGNGEEIFKACNNFHSALERYFNSEEQKIGKEYKVRKGTQWRLTKENSNALRQNILTTHQNLGLPYFILGLHYKKNTEYDRASRNFQKAILWGYDLIECHTQLIDIALFQKDWELALEKAREAQRAVGSQAEFYFLMGYSYYQMGHMARALDCFSNAFDLKPYATEIQKNLAKVYFAMGNFQEAAGFFKRIMKISPFDYNVKFLLDRALNEQRMAKPEQKPKLTKNMIERPLLKYKYKFESDIVFVTELINSAALTLLRKGHLDDAIVMNESFVELFELSPELNYNLGHFYNMKNDLDTALKYAWTAVELKEEFKDALDLIGNIFFKMNDFDNSIKSYNKVIAIDPEDAMSHYNLGCVFAAKGDAEKAEESWLNAIRYEKNERVNKRDDVSEDELSFSLVVVGRRVAFKSYTALGHLYKNQRMLEKALEQFQLALALEPNRSELHYEIGKIHLEQNNIPEAKKSLEKYLFFGGTKEQEVRELLNSLNTEKKF